MRPKLVFREIPGKSAQRRRHARRRSSRVLRAFRDPLCDPVLGMPASPRRLRLLAQLPAARLRAGALPITYARIRTEPSATDRARTRAAHPRASRPSSLGLPSEGGPLLASRGGSFLASVEASRISAENARHIIVTRATTRPVAGDDESSLERRPFLWSEIASHHSSNDPSYAER